jgi:hypothetical protein
VTGPATSVATHASTSDANYAATIAASYSSTRDLNPALTPASTAAAAPPAIMFLESSTVRPQRTLYEHLYKISLVHFH